MRKKLFTAAAVIAFACLASIAAAHGIINLPPEAALGFMLVGHIDFAEIKQLLETQGEAFAAYKTKNDERYTAIEKILGRPGALKSGEQGDLDPEYKKSFLSFMRSGREDGLERKSMSSGSDPDGGYTIPAEFDRELTKDLRDLSPMRQLARVVPVNGPEFTQLHSRGGTTYGWVGETTARPTTSTPSLKAVNIPTKEIYANPAITQNLLDDNAFGLESWLLDELLEAFGDGEGDAFINGDGVAKPRGLFTYEAVSTADATRDHDKFQYVPTGASGAFAATQVDALITLVQAVKPRYRANASWLVGPDFIEAVRKLKNPTTSEYIWRPGAEVGQPDRLLGYPVYEDANVPAIAANSLSAAFGDFKRAYTITDRSTQMLRDPYTSKPYVLFYCTKRVGGGGGRDTRAVKFLKFSAS